MAARLRPRGLRLQTLEERCVLSTLSPVPSSSATSLPQEAAVSSQDTAGNRWSAARDLDSSEAVALAEHVGRGDTMDWYRFETSSDAEIEATVNGLSGNVDVLMLERRHGRMRLLERSRNPGLRSEIIETEVAAGEYYLLVLSRSSRGSEYRLSVNIDSGQEAPPPTPPTPPNDPTPQQPPSSPEQPPVDNAPPANPPSDPPSNSPADQTPNSSGTFSSSFGYGLLDVGAAVTRVLEATSSVKVSPLQRADDWSLNLIHAPTAWSHGATGKEVVVAVVDTGVDYTHFDLDDNIWRNDQEIAGDGVDNDHNGFVDDVLGWDFANGDNDPRDVHGHGTHVAGTIAAENNGRGAIGVAYDAQIMPVQVLGDRGSGSSANVARGIRYAVDNGANVINLSLSLGNGANAAIGTAVQYAADKGVVVVMAAGNQGANRPAFPARLAESLGLAVGAVDANQEMTDFSNRAGADPIQYLVAPGQRVYSTYPGGRFARWSGTSMAAPHVAGAAALLLSADSQLTPREVASVLQSTAQSNSVQAVQQAPTLTANQSLSPAAVDAVWRRVG